MPNLKSARKKVRVSLRQRIRNLSVLRAVRQSVRAAENAVRQAPAEAEKLIREAVRTIDKAWQRGILHKNTAARKKSRLIRKYRTASLAKV